MLSKIFIISGCIVLMHTAFSSYHYKNLRSDAGLGTEHPPIDVFIESFISFLLILIGLIIPLKISPVITSKDKMSKVFEEVMNRQDFMMFSKRGNELHKRISKLKT